MSTCPLAKPALSPARCFRDAHKPSASLRLKGSQFRCKAVAEADTEVSEKEDFDIHNLDSKDFRAVFDNLLEKSKTRFDVGDKVQGIVETVDENGAHVDIGAKAAAFLPTSNISIFKVPRAGQAIQTGEERDFVVSEKHYKSRRKRPAVVLSIKEFEQEVIWRRINQLAEEKASFQEKVVGVNNGGVFVELEGVRAFCPGSHIPQTEKRDGMEALVDRTLLFSILEADQPRLILSARHQLQSRTAQSKEYKVGDVAVGTVQSVQLYGAFLEFEDGTSGLLHVSQISHDRVSNVADVLSIGDKIKVMVLTHDAVRGRLSLSTRKLEPTPGDMLRNPAVVFEKADEMAEEFRKRIAEAEAEFGGEGGGNSF